MYIHNVIVHPISKVGLNYLKKRNYVSSCFKNMRKVRTEGGKGCSQIQLSVIGKWWDLCISYKRSIRCQGTDFQKRKRASRFAAGTNHRERASKGITKSREMFKLTTQQFSKASFPQMNNPLWYRVLFDPKIGQKSVIGPMFERLFSGLTFLLPLHLMALIIDENTNFKIKYSPLVNYRGVRLLYIIMVFKY